MAGASASASSNGFIPQAQQQQNPLGQMMGIGLLFAGLDLIDDGALNGSILQNLMGGGQPQQAMQPPMQPPMMPPPMMQQQQPQQMAQNPIQQNQALGQHLQNIGADLKDDGILNGSHLKQQQPQQQQQQNPMMQMMQMMMQMMMGIMQMIMQMMGMNPQQMQNAMGNNQGGAQATAAASANGNGANAFAAAGAGTNSPFQPAAQYANNPAGNANAFAAAGANNNGASAFAAAGANGSFAFAGAWAMAGNNTGSGQQIEIGKDGKGVWGDPHYEINFDKNGDGKIDKGEGVKFDHKGVNGNTYNIFEGDGISVKGRYDEWKNNPNAPQIIGEVSVNDQAKITKDGKLNMNGQDMNLKQGEKVQMQDGSQLEKTKDGYRVHSKEGDAHIDIRCNGNYIDVDPEGKFGNLGGIVGEAMQKAMNGEKLPGNDYWTQNYDLGKVL